jgi:hypothetical protein
MLILIKQKLHSVVILLGLLISYPLFAQIWSVPERVSPYVTGSYIILSQGLTADSSGRPWCGWAAETYNPSAYDIYVSHYSDTVWSGFDTICSPTNFYTSELATDALGNMWVISTDDSQIFACFYNGISWSSMMWVPSVANTCNHRPVAAGDTLGNLWVCWHARGPGDGHHIWGNAYIQGQWGPPVLISYPGSHDESAYSMTTAKEGLVWVGWFAVFWPDFEAIYVSFNDNNTWSDPLLITEYSPAGRFALLGPALAVDTANVVWAGWSVTDHEDSNTAIYTSYYDGNTWSAPVLVNSEPTVFYSDIAITSDDAGMVWLTWVNSDEDIYYSYWNGNNWSDPVPIDTHPAKDYDPKMTFDGERIWVTWIRRVDLLDTLSVYASYAYGVGVEEKPAADPLPAVSGISLDCPNPFSSKTSMSYQLRSDCRVSLRIHDIAGKLVRTLVNRDQTAGYYLVNWNGKDNVGTQLPAGIYFLRLETSNKSITKKITKLE